MAETNQKSDQLSFCFDSKNYVKPESNVIAFKKYYQEQTNTNNKYKEAFNSLLKEAKELNW